MLVCRKPGLSSQGCNELNPLGKTFHATALLRIHKGAQVYVILVSGLCQEWRPV